MRFSKLHLGLSYLNSCADINETFQHPYQLGKDPSIVINISEVAELNPEMLRPVFLTFLPGDAKQNTQDFKQPCM